MEFLDNHTQHQMNYYWACLRHLVEEGGGHASVESLDAYFKQRLVIGSKTELDVRQFSELIDKVQKIASQEWGVELPDPETLI